MFKFIHNLKLFKPKQKTPSDKLIAHLGLERSPDWTRVRNLFVALNGVCAYCKVNKNLEVHHILPFHLFPSLELDMSNLITLCNTCHFVQGHLGNWSSYAHDIREECIRYRMRVEARPKRQK